MVVFSVGILTPEPTLDSAMNRRVAALGITLVAVLVVGVLLLQPPLWFVDAGDFGNATVTVADENGTQLATVDVRVADTRQERRVGLMQTDSLSNGSGMLFVHPRDAQYTYHMKNMAFDIDIIFVGANGTVTAVRHASAPDAGESTDTYTGRGKYVLEVPRGFANATGIEMGDEVRVPDEVT